MVYRKLYSVTGLPRRLDGGALFGATPRGTWCQWLSPDLENEVELASRALLVQQNGLNILVLAGTDALLAPLPRTCRCQRPPASLLNSLAQLGVEEAQIHAVVLTHLHAMLAPPVRLAVSEGETPRLLFPRAHYLVGRRHWLRASHPHPRDRAFFVPQIISQLQCSGRLHFVDECTSDLLGEGWHLHVSDGHTPGQLLPEIQMPGGPVIFAGDLVPGTPWLALNLTSAYDRNPENLIDEKEHLLDRVVANGGRLFLSRDPHVAMIKVCRDKQHRYQPFDHHAVLHRLDS